MPASIPASRALRALLSISALMVMCLAATPARAQQLVVFGDSLSDEGNYFVETRESSRPPFEPVPSAPYDAGGHHFSNGATWIGYLAAGLGVPGDAAPALQVPGLFANYAFGRARARQAAPQFPDFGLTDQVSLFLSDFGGNAPSDALYVVWIGSNDAFDALEALFADPSGATSNAIVVDALSAISDNLIALSQAGARRFLVLNIPNLASTPIVGLLGSLNPAIPSAAEQIATGFNSGLAAVLDALEPITGAEILRLDTFGIMEAIVANPESAGLQNATDSCIAFGVIGDAFCARPNRYLFWDGAHPTTAGHAVLARAAADLLGGN